jgi:hypothetical protein
MKNLGQCYGKIFLAILTTFKQKNVGYFTETQCCYYCSAYIAVSRVKIASIFLENKIIILSHVSVVSFVYLN